MQINQGVFKSYDIRGVYPSELDEKTAFEVGRAFVAFSGAKKVAIGRDARISGPALFAALAKGIASQGADVTDIGMVPTECLYFAAGFYDFPAGIMITASHNPKEYNGFKMLVKKGKDIEIVRGKDLFSCMGKAEESKNTGKVTKQDIWPDFLERLSDFAGQDTGQLKIAVDASNGAGGLAIGKIKKNLPVEIFDLNFDPDGNFPNHGPNPLEKGSADQIKKVIIKNKCDAGFIFDGDADRIFLADEKGELVRADVTLLMLAKYFLEQSPGSAIAYNAICSKAVPEFIKKWGGVPIRTQVGFVNVREGLIKNDGIMGGELSGHYCFKDNFYLDSGVIALLTLLQIISKTKKPVSELVKELSPYAKGAEINFEVKDKELILSKIKQKYIDGRQDFLDGVTVEYDNWWFNVRPSNTEPLLRLTIEADTPELLEAKQKELTKEIM